MEIEERVIEREYFEKLYQRISRNAEISEFYENLYRDTDKPSYLARAQAVHGCLQWWDTDYYRLQQIKDIKRVNLCRDKFCLNCQCMLASKRQLKYEPLLNSFLGEYDVFHTVMTVTNPNAEQLNLVLDKMYTRFGHFVRYLRGNAKIKGIDFLKYGFGGGLRALEVTYNKETKTFHPHFHCMLLFRKGLDLERTQINSYSFDRYNKKPMRKFSELEILLQKIWFLLMNDVKVTITAIETLKEGYSVIMDNADGHYHEAFKYACKGAFDEAKGAFVYSEEIFRVLRQALHSRRMIQGYGLLRICNDEDGEMLENELEHLYNAMVERLRRYEEPVFQVERFEEVLREKNCKYISKTNLKRLLLEKAELKKG